MTSNPSPDAPLGAEIEAIVQRAALDIHPGSLPLIVGPDRATMERARSLGMRYEDYKIHIQQRSLAAAAAERERITPYLRAAVTDALALAGRDTERLKEVARRQYWALREGDNIVRHIRTALFPGWTSLSDRDVNECLRDYEKEHGIDANYVARTGGRTP